MSKKITLIYVGERFNEGKVYLGFVKTTDKRDILLFNKGKTSQRRFIGEAYEGEENEGRLSCSYTREEKKDEISEELINEWNAQSLAHNEKRRKYNAAKKAESVANLLSERTLDELRALASKVHFFDRSDLINAILREVLTVKRTKTKK